jgi:hypothetical protein
MLSWTLFAWAGYAELVRTRDKTQVEGGWNPRWAGTILPAGLVVLGVGLLVFLNRALLGTDKGVVILGAAGLILLSFLRQSLAVHVKSRHGTPQDRRPDNADEH